MDRPIHLCVKVNTQTELKYFCKTIRADPDSYRGSGSFWRRHNNKHGWEYVKTLSVWTFDNQTDATSFALKFSRDYNIVESNEWANLIEEDAIRGCPPGTDTKGKGKSKPPRDATFRRNISHSALRMSEDKRTKISEASRQASAKKWYVTYPDNRLPEIIFSLSGWSKHNNVYQSNLTKHGHSKGFTAIQIMDPY